MNILQMIDVAAAYDCGTRKKFTEKHFAFSVQHLSAVASGKNKANDRTKRMINEAVTDVLLDLISDLGAFNGNSRDLITSKLDQLWVDLEQQQHTQNTHNNETDTRSTEQEKV